MSTANRVKETPVANRWFRTFLEIEVELHLLSAIDTSMEAPDHQ
jgi:hypothetical protein